MLYYISEWTFSNHFTAKKRCKKSFIIHLSIAGGTLGFPSAISKQINAAGWASCQNRAICPLPWLSGERRNGPPWHMILPVEGKKAGKWKPKVWPSSCRNLRTPESLYLCPQSDLFWRGFNTLSLWADTREFVMTHPTIGIWCNQTAQCEAPN